MQVHQAAMKAFGKRLLVIARAFPYPPNSGYTMRTWALLRGLADNGQEIELLSFGKQADLETYWTEIRHVCHVAEVIPYSPPSISGGADYLGRLKTLLSPVPYSVMRFRLRAMEARIRTWLQARKIDALLCDTPFSFINIRAPLSVPLIVDSQNVEHLILQRYVSLEKSAARRAYVRLESSKLRRWEQHVWSRANLVMVCSEHDRSVVMNLCPETPVAVAPNIVDVESYPATPDGEGLAVLYVGGMDWYPNQDAVEFFISEIFPELQRLVPGVKFVVAGRGPSEKFRRRFAGVPGVMFTGTVPDMRTEMAKATVCVVPLRIGSGTRLKILEAAAMAKPIVSTGLGAEGLEFVDGEDILIADQPRAFARAVADLLADASRCKALGQAARRRVEQQYSFPALRSAVHMALAELPESPLGAYREAGLVPPIVRKARP